METRIRMSPDAFPGAKPHSVSWDNHRRKQCLISPATKDNWILKSFVGNFMIQTVENL